MSVLIISRSVGRLHAERATVFVSSQIGRMTKLLCGNYAHTTACGGNLNVRYHHICSLGSWQAAIHLNVPTSPSLLLDLNLSLTMTQTCHPSNQYDTIFFAEKTNQAFHPHTHQMPGQCSFTTSSILLLQLFRYPLRIFFITNPSFLPSTPSSPDQLSPSPFNSHLQFPITDHNH